MPTQEKFEFATVLIHLGRGTLLTVDGEFRVLIDMAFDRKVRMRYFADDVELDGNQPWAEKWSWSLNNGPPTPLAASNCELDETEIDQQTWSVEIGFAREVEAEE